MISMDSTLMSTVGDNPHDVDAERGLLASIGKDPNYMADATEAGMTADWFMNPICRMVAQKMIESEKEGWECDDITISMAVDKDFREEAFRVFDAVETSARFNYFFDIVEASWLKRATIDSCYRLIEKAKESGSQALDLVDEAGQEFSKLSLRTRNTVTTSAEVIEKTWENILARQKHDGIDGIPSGIRNLDQLTYGWHGGDVILVAARTSVGKTAFSCELTLSALKARKSVQYFSLEMQNESVMERMLANVSGVPVRVMVDKVMTSGQQDSVEQAKDFFRHAKLYMEDDGYMSVASIRAKARKMARKGLDMIVIDYAQLIRPEDPRASREQQVAMISKGIKMLAKELQIPIIMLAQLRREADRSDECPKLSDLRESGSLEQDADLVCMLWKKTDKSGDEHHVVTVAKQRQGRVGEVPLNFKPSIQQFTEREVHRLN